MSIIVHNKLEFILEQMTPMLHFQGEEGAGIRGSDLKPRFDQFLKRYCYDLKSEEGRNVLKKLLLRQDEESSREDKEQFSFDYKVRVHSERFEERNTPFYKQNRQDKVYGAYFGENRRFSFHHKVKVEFITAHKEIKKIIEEYFPVFISINSFGTRKNKGYGYFKLKGKEAEDIIYNVKKYQCFEKSFLQKQNIVNSGVGIYRIQVKNKRNKPECIQGILKVIKEFHQILKSGINFGKYQESLMLKKHPACSTLLLEKKAMKISLSRDYNISKLTKEGSHFPLNQRFDGEVASYVRGLLGLSPHYEFRNVRKKKGGGEFVAGFDVDISEIRRFESPIRYLPISYDGVLIVVDYGQIEEFRKACGSRTKEFKGYTIQYKQKNPAVNQEFNFEIPGESEYSVWELFKEKGVIDKLVNSENSPLSGKITSYKVESDYK